MALHPDQHSDHRPLSRVPGSPFSIHAQGLITFATIDVSYLSLQGGSPSPYVQLPLTHHSSCPFNLTTGQQHTR